MCDHTYIRYHGDKNVMAMLAVVEPLHEELLKGAHTSKEESFEASLKA